jgi:hypothetical protein
VSASEAVQSEVAVDQFTADWRSETISRILRQNEGRAINHHLES